MQLTRKFDQHRFDFSWDYECELCGHTGTNTSGYDDYNYHINVIPKILCPICNKSSNDAIALGIIIDLNKLDGEGKLVNTVHRLLTEFPNQTFATKLDYIKDIRQKVDKLELTITQNYTGEVVVRINDIRSHINYMSNYKMDEHKLSSILHRIEIKDSPNAELIRSLSKLYTLSDDVVKYCNEIDFNDINKSGTGARGEDVKDIRQKYTKTSNDKKEYQPMYFPQDGSMDPTMDQSCDNNLWKDEE
jgi:hypothetical protein